MMHSPSRTVDSVLFRLALQSGRLPSVLGTFGRQIGRRQGVLLSCGYRMIIQDPREYIQRCVIAHGAYEPGIARTLAKIVRPGDVFLDVGANIGHHSLVAASGGAIVHAFEPLPRLAERLRENFQFNHIEDRLVLNVMAVGAAGVAGAVLYEATRADDGSHSIIAGVPAESHRSLQVNMTALDSYVSKKNLTPALIKIDVEGYEARVLDGSARLLAGDAPPFVILETGDRLADQIGESAESVLGRLETLGYQLFRLDEWSGQAAGVRATTAGGELANYLAVHPANINSEAVLEAISPAIP
jgi:FkbM family methyltransferase